ncbi:hypothetical protein I4U23_016991 [Adineta vaga]|nr:hypothetical protein I4U23_016991 [Adineta vaga]
MMKFEGLANEIFYAIFEYLHHFQAYEIFFNLNQRFQNLFINSTYPIQIQLDLISKSTFISYYENIILPYQHRIQLLHLTNPFHLQFFLSNISIISKLVHLKRLIIDYISFSHLEQFF